MSTRARGLRRNLTAAEERLWAILRNRQLEGAKFRRQHPMGRYVVDFFCAETNLIVELDGSGHQHTRTEDALRTASLEESGNRVLRFWNNDVLTNPEGVAERICDVLLTPHPDPLPQGERG